MPVPSSGPQPLADLPNLGPKSQQMLAQAGITSLEQLRALGAVAAYVRAQQAGGRVSLNLLWALEGTLTGLPWQTVAREHRTSLLLALEQAQRQARSAATIHSNESQRLSIQDAHKQLLKI